METLEAVILLALDCGAAFPSKRGDVVLNSFQMVGKQNY